MIDQAHTPDPTFLDRLQAFRERTRREVCPADRERACAEQVEIEGMAFCRLGGVCERQT